MKCGNLNFLEPSGPLQACNGTALLLLKNPTLRPVIRRNFTVGCIKVKVGEFRQKMETKVIKYIKLLIKLISFTNFNAQFLYPLTICMLHYNPRHVSSCTMLIFSRKNCIITASGIVTLCTVQPFTNSDYNRCCDNTIFPPEDGHVNVRNMSRIVM